jgi:hypothetical protein
VRDTEARTRTDVAPPAVEQATPENGTEVRQHNRSSQKMASADTRRIEDSLRKRLGTDIRVTSRRRGRGFISISYYSNDDLARVLELILGEPFDG